MKHKTYKDGILYNGDCLKVLPKLIKQGIKVDAIITDVPYGTTGCYWDNIIPFDKMWECLTKISYDTTPIALFGCEPFSSALRMSNTKMYKYDWIWEKHKAGNFALAKYQPMKYHELISIFYKKFGLYKPQMIKRESDRIKQAHKTNYVGFATNKGEILAMKSLSEKDFNKYDAELKLPNAIIKFNAVQSNSNEKCEHPTQKPVALMEYLIKTYTNEGDLVLDFTCGSGSTLIACRNLKRRFIGIEKEEKYYKICKQRLKNCSIPIF